MVKFLISRGASVDAADEEGEYIDPVRMTITAGADLA